MPQKVLVTGMGVISPLGPDVTSTWKRLVGGESGVGPITLFNPEGFETTFAAEVKGFDPTRYMERKEARRMDRFVQFAMAAASEALNQANLNREALPVDPYRISVIVGSGIGGIGTTEEQVGVLHNRGPGRVDVFTLPRILADMASGRISMMIGAKGQNCCVVSSCSSGADAIGLGWKLIRWGDADIVIVGGAEAPICPIGVASFNALHALSKHNENPRQASRPFDAGRDGFVMGEGATILVMETEESMERRGVKPLAEVLAYAATSDAYHETNPSPDGKDAAKAMELAMEKAGIQPEDVDYINAHGTSTPLNDRLETLAIKSALGKHAYRVPISSTKSMTGHLLGAGGALEAAACILAIQHGVIPPTINLEHQDPDCDLDYVPKKARPCKVEVAMSNSFGFGGHNSVLILAAPGIVT
ncbi:MAG: beta-ketoacyl-ACP synthase II [Patescibacteria group bacterium]